DEKTVRAAREPAVGNQGDISAQPRTHNGAGNREHLGHPGTALRTFVTDENHIPFLNLLPLEAVQHLFFTVVAAGRTGELETFLPRNLGNRAIRAEVAPHDANMPHGLDRLLDWVDHLLPFSQAFCFD